jgi:hypothetical protein
MVTKEVRVRWSLEEGVEDTGTSAAIMAIYMLCIIFLEQVLFPPSSLEFCLINSVHLRKCHCYYYVIN